MKRKQVALYLRVSTAGQTVENQRRELESAAERNGWEVIAVYEDAGISGVKGRDKRPGWDALLKAVARREIELVAVSAVDRLARSLKELVLFLEELKAKGVGLYLHREGMDTSTPMGEAMLQVAGIFASLERSILAERVKSGMARAKAQGQRIGRPRVPDETRCAILKARARGLSMAKVAQETGVSPGTVHSVLAEGHESALDANA